MATTFTTNKLLSKLATGDAVGAWGPVIDTNMDLVDAGFGGILNLTLTNADVALTATQANNAAVYISGTITRNNTVTFPATAGVYIIRNYTSGNFVTTFAAAGGGLTVRVPQTHAATVFCDGTNVLLISSTYQPFWRLSAPTTTIPNNAGTQITNYALSDANSIDNGINATTGVVTIGPSDAGIYTLTASCSTPGPLESAAVTIFLNGVALCQEVNPATTLSNNIHVSVSTVKRLASGDVLYMTFLQVNANGGPDTTQAFDYNNFSGVRVTI